MPPEIIPGTLVKIEFTKEQGDRFYAAIGRCIAEWARIDRLMFELCETVLKTDEKLAAIIYYKQNTIGNKRQLVEELCGAGLSEAEQKSLKPTWDFVETYLWIRNAVAHYPTEIQFEIVYDLKAEGGPKAIRQGSQVFSITEPKQLLRGGQEKRLGVEELEVHVGLVQKAYEQFNAAINVIKFNRTKVSEVAQPAAVPLPSQQASPPAQATGSQSDPTPP